jgi:hypothetical protein
MNNLLTSAALWFASMDISAHSVAGGLHVSKNDITTWATPDEILADLKEAMDAKGLNGKKLSWVKTEETMGWLKLDSF